MLFAGAHTKVSPRKKLKGFLYCVLLRECEIVEHT